MVMFHEQRWLEEEAARRKDKFERIFFLFFLFLLVFGRDYFINKQVFFLGITDSRKVAVQAVRWIAAEYKTLVFFMR